VVERGDEREFLAPLPLDLLEPEPRLRSLLDGVGIGTCGELAALPREAVEVRFGADALTLWRLARADDRRSLFRPIPPERPHASLDFLDYEIREAPRLVFTVNALLGNLRGGLEERGEVARSMTLSLILSDGDVVRERVGASRPTASRDIWIRRLQSVLDRVRLPRGVTGVSLEVDEAEPASSTQGDLFDRGFGTASAVEEAVARLLDEQGLIFVSPEITGHPLAESGTRWVPRGAAAAARAGVAAAQPPALTLQLLREPRPTLPIPTVSGPDRIAGGRWSGSPYARDYFRCITEDGRLVWIYRDLKQGRWYLHGWWD
jgi:protein ImuB